MKQSKSESHRVPKVERQLKEDSKSRQRFCGQKMAGNQNVLHGSVLIKVDLESNKKDIESNKRRLCNIKKIQ